MPVTYAPPSIEQLAATANETINRFWVVGIALLILGGILWAISLDAGSAALFVLGVLTAGVGQIMVLVGIVSTGVKWGTAASRKA
jgi:hypothetical protein